MKDRVFKLALHQETVRLLSVPRFAFKAPTDIPICDESVILQCPTDTQCVTGTCTTG